jgi:formate/nitrite transporter FocA (FNT family)
MDNVNPKEVMQEVIVVAKRKSELSAGDMLIRGILAGAFPGFATSLAFFANARGLAPIAGSILFPAGNIVSGAFFTGFVLYATYRVKEIPAGGSRQRNSTGTPSRVRTIVGDRAIESLL